jgi:voltage-gated potassium channel Kch
MGRTGTAAYDYLDDSLRCPAGLDRDAERVSTHRRQGRRVLHGDPCDPSLWSRIDVRRADGVLLAGSDLGRQLETIRVLRASGYRGAIYALTARPENRDVLHDAGANTVYLSIDRAGRALAAHGLKHAKDGAPRTVTLSVGVDQVETDETPRRRTAPSK